MSAPPRVLMIFGFPRSGSTVLGLHLQEHLGGVFCGELNNLWKRYQRGRPCSCGRPLGECEVWSAVAERTLGAADSTVHTVEQAAAIQTREETRLGPEHRATYGTHLAALYREMAAVFDTELVIDSSKGVGDASLVQEVDGIDAWFLYLVRDPRGTAYSRSRGRAERLAAGERRRSRIERWDDFWLSRDAWEWDQMDRRAAELLARVPAERQRTLRYEDFATAPEQTLDGLVEWLGGPLVRPEVAGEEEEGHVLGGNQGVLRTQHGASAVTPDRRWQSGLRPYKRRLLELITSRGRRRHGYR